MPVKSPRMMEERADFPSAVRVLAFETFQKDSIHSTGEERRQREAKVNFISRAPIAGQTYF